MHFLRIFPSLLMIFMLSTCTLTVSMRRSRRYNAKLCQRISIPVCSNGNLPYDHTGRSTPNESIVKTYWPMIMLGCSEHIRLFLCSFAYPSCLPQDGTLLPPCRSLCVSVMQKCQPMIAREFVMSWPEDLECSQFANENCMDTHGPVLTPPPPTCAKTIDIEDTSGAQFNFDSSRVDVVLDSANAIVDERSLSPEWADLSVDFRTTSASTQVIFVASSYPTPQGGRSYENSVVAFLHNGFLGCNVHCGIVRSDFMDNVRVPLNDGKWHKLYLDSRLGLLHVDDSIPAVQCYGGASDCREFGELTIGNWMRGVAPVQRIITGDLSEARFDGCMRNMKLSRDNQTLPVITRYNYVSNCCG